jgi:glucan phosphoethanolaminetransferase (alkaline phosphatase superfamily)
MHLLFLECFRPFLSLSIDFIEFFDLFYITYLCMFYFIALNCNIRIRKRIETKKACLKRVDKLFLFFIIRYKLFFCFKYKV